MKVLDFGLAKAFQPDPESDPSQSPTLTAVATRAGIIMGTAAYMSPEQAKGRPVDKRSDVWAFGAVLFEMLTGTRAFAGDDVSDTMAAVLRAEVNLEKLPDETPSRLRRVLQASLQRDPRQRVHDVADVRLAMEGAFETTVSVPADTATAAPQQFWQRPGPALIAMLLVAVLTGLAGWSLRPTEPRAITRFPYDLPPNHVLRATTRGGSPFRPTAVGSSITRWRGCTCGRWTRWRPDCFQEPRNCSRARSSPRMGSHWPMPAEPMGS